MFDNGTLLSSMLRNPLDVQNKVLEELEDRYQGEKIIADSNSAFCNLLEFGSSITTACMQEIDNVVIPGIYAKRAQNFKSISRHMSDFDYVNLFGTPSHTELLMMLDTVTLFDKAEDYNAYYKKATIPVDSIFNVGSYQFGIYYPIEIQINKFNQNILVLQNINNEHPLHKVTTNTLEHWTQTIQGVPMLSFNFPVYQFSRSYIIEDAYASTGFAKSYDYNYQFYACRVFTYFPSSDKWIELSQTTSDIMYDPVNVTAKLSIDPDTHKFKITIPQIYFDSGKMGTKVMIELYVTQGELNVDISRLPENAFSASFFNNKYNNSDKFSQIFKQYPSLRILPISTKIVGGNDGNDFDEVKTRVINNISHRSLLITPDDITKYFEDQQFKVTKYLDNITNRIYFCNGVLIDNDKSYIPVTNSYVKISDAIIDGTSDILRNKSTSVTILPTAMYRYNASGNFCEILSDVDKTVLNNMTKEVFVEELNNTVYTKTPFHIVVNVPPARYQIASSYNLFSTKVNSIQFKYDNEEIMAQMVGYSATISHNDNGRGGYTIRFIVAKSDDLKEVPEEDLLVFVTIKDSLGAWCGRQAEFIGTQAEYFIYELKLETDYSLSNDTINITNIDFEFDTLSHVIDLETDFHVVYFIKNEQVPNVKNDYYVIEGIRSDITNYYIGMGRQIFNIHLGHHLDNIIYNMCDMDWSKQTYATYETDEYKTYVQDVYETNEDGTIKITIEDGKVITNKLHSAGEIIMDEEGNPSIAHAKGDIKRSPNGDLIVTANRTYQCMIYMMMIDARMYYSEDPTHSTFISDLPNILESYFETIKTAKDKILEETELYFRPIRTIGLSEFSIGDGRTIKQSLDMSFRMKLHVPSFVKNSEEIQTQIKNSIVSITERAIATSKTSMTDIANTIKAKLLSYIDNIDVLGINGDNELQTVHVLDDDSQASVARVLTILKDGTISLEKDITLDFVATEKILLT